MKREVRAVLDTNVVLAANRTKSAASPNLEILRRWEAGEFILLYSEDVLIEYAEKLLLHGVSETKLRHFIAAIRGVGDRVVVAAFHLRRYPSDADDIAFVLCALNGEATHLVTYDGDFQPVAGEFGFVICEPLPFLAGLRLNQP